MRLMVSSIALVVLYAHIRRKASPAHDSGPNWPGGSAI